MVWYLLENLFKYTEFIWHLSIDAIWFTVSPSYWIWKKILISIETIEVANELVLNERYQFDYCWASRKLISLLYQCKESTQIICNVVQVLRIIVFFCDYYYITIVIIYDVCCYSFFFFVQFTCNVCNVQWYSRYPIFIYE